MNDRNTLIESYNRQAQARDKQKIEAWKVTERTNFLHQLQAAGKRTLLDIGAGTGHDGQFFAQAGLDVTCIDLSPEMVNLCQAKGLQAQEMDLLNLTFDPATFDAVWSANCLLHLPHEDWPTALRQIKQIMQPKGLFHLRVYGGERFSGIFEEDHYIPKRFYNLYPDEEVKAIVSEHFTILDFQTFDLGEKPRHSQIFTLTVQSPHER